MKVAILSESPADEAFVAVLAQSALGRQIELVQPRLRSRGWPSVRNLLPAVYKHLTYHTEADGLVLVVDSDDSAVHQERAGQAPFAVAILRVGCVSFAPWSLRFINRSLQDGYDRCTSPWDWRCLRSKHGCYVARMRM